MPPEQTAQEQVKASVMGFESFCTKAGRASSDASSELTVTVLALAGLLTASIAAKEPAQPKAVNTVL